MSDLEAAAQPILKEMMTGGIPRLPIAEKQQLILSAWAYKMTLMAELTNEVPLIPESAYRDFFEVRRPPWKRAIVWCAAYMGADHYARYERIMLSSYGSATSRRRQQQSGMAVKGYLATFSLLCVVFQVFGHTEGEYFPSTGNPKISRFMYRFWPPSGAGALWPKGNLALSAKDLIALSARVDFGVFQLPPPEQDSPVRG